MDDTGSPEVWNLSTNWRSPELLMMEMGFAECWYQVAVLRIAPPWGEQARVSS